jgi:hypothetical protein
MENISLVLQISDFHDSTDVMVIERIGTIGSIGGTVDVWALAGDDRTTVVGSTCRGSHTRCSYRVAYPSSAG